VTSRASTKKCPPSCTRCQSQCVPISCNWCGVTFGGDWAQADNCLIDDSDIAPHVQEIDYLNEGRNADRFRRNFQGIDWVESPVVHWGYTSARVITLSYLPGIKVSYLSLTIVSSMPMAAAAKCYLFCTCCKCRAVSCRSPTSSSSRRWG
jgi:ABC1 atypical kinase-like domain